MATANQAIQRTASQVNASPAEASDGCYICKSRLWISVFFDEPGHDAEKERGTDLLSNIGRLFYAHEDARDRGIFAIYYNGLGVAFKEPNVVRKKTAVDNTKEESTKVVKDEAKGVAMDTAMGQGKEAIGDLKNPKKWGWQIAGILGKDLIESLSFARDKKWMTNVLLSGVSTRVNSALEKIAQIVQQPEMTIEHIDVAVFGAGLGGAMARLFINELQAVCKQRGSLYYPTPGLGNGEATMEIQFLGLLDCMSSNLGENFVADQALEKLSFGFAKQRIDGPMGISERVGKTVHYVAAHELRVTKRVDSIRKGEGSMSSEVLLPGNHNDLVGNYPDTISARSYELSRVALKKLHGDAFASGVPIMSMGKLKKVDIDLFQLFEITSAVAVHDGIKIPLERLLKRYGDASGTLEAQFLEHNLRFLSWMRHRYDTPGHFGRPPQKAYDFIDQQIEKMNRLVHHPRSTYSPSKEEREMLKVWKSPLKLDDYQMALFDNYVHDELHSSAIDAAAADAGVNGYFKLRGIDESDKLKK